MVSVLRDAFRETLLETLSETCKLRAPYGPSITWGTVPSIVVKLRFNPDRSLGVGNRLVRRWWLYKAMTSLCVHNRNASVLRMTPEAAALYLRPFARDVLISSRSSRLEDHSC